jgi:ubiquinone/menaquinone biosynthesis C-methylase UbiE
LSGLDAPEQVLVGCDQPLERGAAIAHNELLVSGWAASPSGIAGVVVQIGDRSYHATYGLSSPSVAETLHWEEAARAGYRLRIDSSGWRAGTHPVKVTAFARDGESAAIEGEIEVLPFEAPRYTTEDNRADMAAGKVAMWLEQPRIVEGPCEAEGYVEVAGWAYSEQGIEAVLVSIDGRSSFDAARPTVRPDLLETYGPAAAASAGFALRLHPEECPPGPHALTVVAIGTDGHAVGVAGRLTCLPPRPPAPPPTGDAIVDWLPARPAPTARPADAPERYDPAEHRGSLIEAEHELRYRWCASAAAGREVLDAGCGVGWGTALLAAAGPARLVGMDISEDALAEARKRTRGLDVELRRGDLLKLPFDERSFDLVTCFEAIEHVVDPDVALDELRRVLRPDGVLLISTPRRQPSLRENVHHVREYAPGEFERALGERFANVRTHRQQTCLASTLLDDEALAIDDGATDLGMEVRKLHASRAGGEGYTVVVAGDGPLPELGRMSLLASPRMMREAIADLQRWEDRAAIAEAEAAASRAELNIALLSQEANVRTLHERLTREKAELQAALEDTRLELERTRTLRRDSSNSTMGAE